MPPHCTTGGRKSISLQAAEGELGLQTPQPQGVHLHLRRCSGRATINSMTLLLQLGSLGISLSLGTPNDGPRQAFC